VLPVQWRGRTCFVAATSSAVHLICGEQLAEVLRIPTPSSAATVSLDGQRVINDQVNGTLAAWQLDGGLEVQRIVVGGAVRSIALALDRSWLAAGSDDGAVTVFDTATGQQRHRLQVPQAITKLTRSADGRLLLVSTAASFHVFDTTTWQALTAQNYRGTLAYVALTPDQRLLIAIGDHSVMGFSPSDWRKQFEVDHDGSIDRVAIDAAASRLATTTQYAGGHDSGVQLARVIDLASGKQLAWAYTSGGGSFSKQRMQQLIAEHRSTPTGGDAALLAQAESWSSIPVSLPSSPKVTTTAWTAEGSANVITASHAPTQRVIGEWDQQGEVTDLLFLPENEPRWLVSASDDGRLRLWPLTSGDLIAEACARLKTLGQSCPAR